MADQFRVGYVYTQEWRGGYWVFDVHDKGLIRDNMLMEYRRARKAGCPRENAKALVRNAMLLAGDVLDRTYVDSRNARD